MKEALLTALEPLLLMRAGALARALPGERRPRVQELSRAASLRERLCRELREPEAIPAALGLGREAVALSVSALLASRGELAGDALAPAAAFGALGELELSASSELEKLMTSTDPSAADALHPDAQRKLQDELDTLLAALRSRYEPRSTKQLSAARLLRLTLLVALVSASALGLLAVLVRP